MTSPFILGSFWSWQNSASSGIVHFHVKCWKVSFRRYRSITKVSKNITNLANWSFCFSPITFLPFLCRKNTFRYKNVTCWDVICVNSRSKKQITKRLSNIRFHLGSIFCPPPPWLTQTWLLYRFNLYNSDFWPFSAKIPISRSELVYSDFWVKRRSRAF